MKWLLKIFFSVICCHCVAAAEASRQIADRILLEINPASFTQRQMEMHLAVKNALSEDTPFEGYVNEKNWSTALDLFRQDMLILQEIRRQPLDRASSKILSDCLAIIKQKKSNSTAMQELFSRLNVSEQDLLKLSSDHLQILAYRKTKIKALEKDWMKRLEERYVARFFAGSEVFQKISFPSELVKTSPSLDATQ